LLRTPRAQYMVRMKYPDRYEKNHQALGPEDQERLAGSRVFVAGCGGLGGYVIQLLARAGVGHITVADPDSFSETNLNRQLFCTEDNLGMPKVDAVASALRMINSEIAVYPLRIRIGQANAVERMAGHQLIIDAVDTIEARFDLERAAEGLGIPLVHGAIAGWYGQVAVNLPGDGLFKTIYGTNAHRDDEEARALGNPGFTPAVIAAYMAAEAVKILCGKPGVLRRRLLIIDLLEHESRIVDLG
jgi:molybdopterin/thiamine biosynthesis adenylyltransferase